MPPHTQFQVASSSQALRRTFSLFCTACGLTIVVPRVASPLFASPQHHDWHPSISPGSTKLLVTHRVTVLEFCRRMASSVYEYSSCRSAVCTACVMLSADSTRRGSHAAAQDVFEQVPTHCIHVKNGGRCQGKG